MAPIVIIGAGLAAWTTVRELRRAELAQGLAAAPVLVVTADSGDFYAKPSLSNAFAQGRSAAQLVTTPAAKMAQDQRVQLMPNTRVESIDVAGQLLHTTRGPVAYAQLVLATGAAAIRLPLAGSGAAQVLSVNSLDDFAVFSRQLQAIYDAKLDSSPIPYCASSSEKYSNPQAKPRLLIMGAGLIGCEFANDLAAAGYPVQVVDPAARPLAALLPEAASLQLHAALAKLGVQWHLGTTVQRIEQRVSESGTAPAPLEIYLANGVLAHADLVLSAIGLRANTQLAAAAGLRTDRGVWVDAQLQTSARGIYAIGDAAQYASAAAQVLPGYSATGATLPYVMPIMAAAKVLAHNLLAQGSASLAFTAMPVAVKTPALPLVVAPPQPGQPGSWSAASHTGSGGEWQWLDSAGQIKGFALSGSATPQRAKWAKALGW